MNLPLHERQSFLNGVSVVLGDLARDLYDDPAVFARHVEHLERAAKHYLVRTRTQHILVLDTEDIDDADL